MALPAAAGTADDLGQRLDAAIHPAELSGWMREMASQPNQVGSPHDKANADYELGLFRQWGWDAHLETFEVLYPTPLSEVLETADKSFHATLQERAVPGDASSGRTAGALPAYVAYQGDGDVTAPLVYVNYGMQDDYLALQRLGVDVRGKIVIARYGHGWRGLKPKLARTTAPSAASSIPILPMTATQLAKPIPMARCGRSRASSADRWRTCRSIRAIR